MRNYAVSLSASVKWQVLLASGALLVALLGVPSATQDAAVKAPPDAGTYRALYVDGKYSCVGIGAITIDAKDVLIEWRMEKFSVEHQACD